MEQDAPVPRAISVMAVLSHVGDLMQIEILETAARLASMCSVAVPCLVICKLAFVNPLVLYSQWKLSAGNTL